jgi:hypothetical protein
MTARPLDLESRGRTLRIAVALVLVMGAVLLAAGCMGGDLKMDQDLAVIKLNQNGSLAWMKMIDSGKDDEVTDVIQTSDGGFVIAGGYSTPMCNAWSHFPTTPRIIRLSDKGDALWEKEYTSEMTDKSGYADPIKGLVQTPDNGFYVVSQRGNILKISPEGIPRGSRLHDIDVLNKTEVESILRAHDGGSVIAGYTLQCKFDQRVECPPDHRDFKAFVEKLDQNGETSWSQSYADRKFFIASQISELNNDKGYASVMEISSNESLVILDKNGMLKNSSVIGSNLPVYKMQPSDDGFVVFCLNRDMNYTYENYYYNNEGIKIDTRSTGNFKVEYAYQDFNQSAGITDMIFLTMKMVQSDLSAHPKTNVSVLRINEDGQTLWESQITPINSGSNYIHIRNLLGTSDGGYMLVLGVEKTQSC